MTQLALPLVSAAQFAADDFIVSRSNQQAHGWIQRWPRWPASALALTGPPRSGKTHLVEIWRKSAGAWRLEGPQLQAQLHACLEAGGCGAVEQFEQADERALFHLLEHARLHGGALLLTSALPPDSWRFLLADVRSRLNALPKAVLEEPDEALLEALLIKLLSDRQLTVPPEVAAFLARRMERSFAAAEALVDALDAASLQRGRDITTALAREVLLSFFAGSGLILDGVE
ncbi:MAG: hypothetical protein JO089_02575 [Alphaproteobacteria bacterium]|nr:hypothetical protein [Alphaproteobacteria bacterium]